MQLRGANFAFVHQIGEQLTMLRRLIARVMVGRRTCAAEVRNVLSSRMFPSPMSHLRLRLFAKPHLCRESRRWCSREPLLQRGQIMAQMTSLWGTDGL